MKKLLTIIALALVFSGCAKKQEDTTPVFSMDIYGAAYDPAKDTLSVQRQQPTVFGEVAVHPSDLKQAVRIEKQITCGSMTVSGKAVATPNIGVLDFKISEEEFPGFNSLPMISDCSLAVTLFNTNGSSHTIRAPLHLKFDTPPVLDIVAQRATTGLQPQALNQEFVVEKFVVKNPYGYSIPMNYVPRYITRTRAKYCVRISGWPDNCGWYGYTGTRYMESVKGTRIEIVGNPTGLETDNSTHAKFKLDPGVEVTITAYGRMPEANIRWTQNWCPQTGPCGPMTYQATWVDGGAGAPSLTQARGFAETDEDTANPIGAVYEQAVSAIPGIVGDPQFAAHVPY